MPAPLRLHVEGTPSRADEPQLFAKAPEHAIDDPRLTGTDHRVLVAIAFLARQSFPNYYGDHEAIASKAMTTTRTIRRSMVKFEEYGYARQITHGHIILTYETRAPFRLESGDTGDASKRTKRTGLSGSNRTDVSASKRTKRTPLSGSLLFEEREKEIQRERSSSPAAMTGPPTTTVESKTPPLRQPAGPTPPAAELARLKAVALSLGNAAQAARGELRRLVALGQLDGGDIPAMYPGERMPPPAQNENRLREPLAKVPPQPAGASVPGCSDPVYPSGQTEIKSREPMPAQ